MFIGPHHCAPDDRRLHASRAIFSQLFLWLNRGNKVRVTGPQGRPSGRSHGVCSLLSSLAKSEIIRSWPGGPAPEKELMR
jgi:hypothetical protein